MNYTRKYSGGFEFSKIYDCPILKSGKKAAPSTCVKEFVSANNFKLIKTADDGNCFYDTLSKFGQKTKFSPLNKSHLELRKIVVFGLLNDIDEIAPYFVTNNNNNNQNMNSIEKQILKLAKPNVWNSNAGDIVIQYASKVFRVNINIFDVKNDYPNDIINKIHFNSSNNTLNTVNMLRINDSHFMLLLPSDLNNNILISKNKNKTHINKTKKAKNISINKVTNTFKNLQISK